MNRRDAEDAEVTQRVTGFAWVRGQVVRDPYKSLRNLCDLCVSVVQ
jgi:hypothetical protein